MNESLTRKTNLFGAWCVIAYIVLLFFGWFVVAGFLPLHSPSAGAEEIASFLRGDVTRIRIGMIMVMWSAAVFLPFTATVADYVAGVEGRYGPLAITTALAGYANTMLTFYPPLWWITSTWRAAERSAETLYLLNDIAWLQFIGGLSVIMPMFVTVAVAAWNDTSARPALPRWCAYASILAFILMLPDQILFFFKSGPFAWNGLISFWLVVSALCLWWIMLFVFMRRSNLRER